MSESVDKALVPCRLCGAKTIYKDAVCGDCEDSDLLPHLARAWDEGATKASPHGGGYLRSLLIENPYRPVAPGQADQS